MAAVEGTVAAAAQRLGGAQPTIGAQIEALERTLGMTRFGRAPAGLKLTEAGRRAFERTSVMFRAGERLVETLGYMAADMPRTLRVGIGSSIARRPRRVRVAIDRPRRARRRAGESPRADRRGAARDPSEIPM